MLSETIHLSELPKPLSKVKESCPVQQRPKQMNCSAGGRPTKRLATQSSLQLGPGPAPLETSLLRPGSISRELAAARDQAQPSREVQSQVDPSRKICSQARPQVESWH